VLCVCVCVCVCVVFLRSLSRGCALPRTKICLRLLLLLSSERCELKHAPANTRSPTCNQIWRAAGEWRCSYLCDWVAGLATTHNITVDFIGLQNEGAISGGDAQFATALRAELDGRGFGSVLIDCCDSHDFGFVTELANHSSPCVTSSDILFAGDGEGQRRARCVSGGLWGMVFGNVVGATSTSALPSTHSIFLSDVHAARFLFAPCGLRVASVMVRATTTTATLLRFHVSKLSRNSMHDDNN
jgi:hypothetical protein